MSAGSKRDEVCVQGLAVSGENGDGPRRDRGYPCCQSHQDLWPVPGCFGRALLWLPLELGVLDLEAGAQVPASGHPLQPLLTRGLFLFPVALQMPEGLLMFACTIVDIVER